MALALTRCADGDHAAFASLYDDVAGRVYGLALRVVGDAHQAEEVAQEVMLQIWNDAARFDPAKGRALTWVLTLAHRRAVDRVRSAQATRRRDDAHASRSQDTAYDATVETADQSAESLGVVQALKQLTPLQAEAVSLAYLGGHTLTEVSSLLGIPVSTAKTRVRDGLLRLRADLVVA